MLQHHKVQISLSQKYAPFYGEVVVQAKIELYIDVCVCVYSLQFPKIKMCWVGF